MSWLNVHIPGEEVANRVSVMELTIPGGHHSGLHRHTREDEVFYVLEGEVTLHVGLETTVGHPGDCLLGPCDVPHAFHAHDGPARILLVVAPGGFEQALPEMGSMDPGELYDRFGLIRLGPEGRDFEEPLEVPAQRVEELDRLAHGTLKERMRVIGVLSDWAERVRGLQPVVAGGHPMYAFTDLYGWVEDRWPHLEEDPELDWFG